MKRIIGIMVGLSLGWLAAGYVFAEPHGGHEVAEAAHAHGDHATTAVSQLAEGAVAGAPWLSFVLVFALCLFGAGIFVNIMGWAKPQPLEDEHDDHGHDAHH
ncbi:MAG: hypothetical protein CMJ19_03950 [Phycisphaeraceae bacterium]|nr:hypothetical protein [Phycisphaeraceae bacterium]